MQTLGIHSHLPHIVILQSKHLAKKSKTNLAKENNFLHVKEHVLSKNPTPLPGSKVKQNLLNKHQAAIIKPTTGQKAPIINGQYLSQQDFIQKGMKKRIVDCGGGGDCLVYSIMRQLPEYRSMFENHTGNIFESMVQFRHKVAAFAKEKHGKYVADLEKNLENSQNLPSATESDKKKREKEVSKYTALLKDAQKEALVINDLDTVHRTLDVCGEEGKWIAMYTQHSIATFSEYNPHSNECTIECFFCRTPNGEASMDKYSESSGLSADTIAIYHVGNDKGGHYQAII